MARQLSGRSSTPPGRYAWHNKSLWLLQTRKAFPASVITAAVPDKGLTPQDQKVAGGCARVGHILRRFTSYTAMLRSGYPFLADIPETNQTSRHPTRRRAPGEAHCNSHADLLHSRAERRRPCGPQDKTGVDPNRVGGPVNHLLGETLSTVIGATAAGDSAASTNLRRMAARWAPIAASVGRSSGL